ncbi:aldehyde dehydrogenase family protein [Mycobacterium sp. CVI_P3]|uniref:Putative succinate-semialdehyde dehydrogenase [NADP(+)] 2 n=1 Tax=Mycobacterium pinniadriaticum TaxID=2994102 RepID=A0ABT3SMR0_9MYCO|nr:aldehyde dehydrogenase family protein [Mycobacterium pinniadriaticum]MCX2934398.1 aldehyde dehydrogenase family protein [Mycobacterium pinniadriaticum]MCX2940821.1 aldehyde dehydrogenase family protein [Mycobacterium pinniadriaticum]
MTAVEPKADQATITVRNPADGRVAGTVPVDGPDTVAAKARELRLYQTEWEEIGPRGRKAWMFKWQDWILDNADHLTEVLMSETGKSRKDASLEPVALADSIKYWAGNAEAFLADAHPKPHTLIYRVKKLTTVYRPYQLVGIIEPWNFPLAMLALDVVPALAAGAAVLLKPSEVTPLSAVEFARGWTEVGAPPVLGLATGYGETGAAVIDNADYVHFTGSTATGRKVAVACAQQLKPLSLELGGKDPAIVLADADVDRAANGIAWGGMFNSGQVCISVERVYVEAPVYDEFVRKLTANVRNIAQGQEDSGFKYDTGAMATAAQCDIVDRHVQEAVAAGARVLTGGKPTGVGTFFQPTVLADVTPAMSCIAEETFGPTLPVVKVADEDEAIRLANDSKYGLSATVWTGDIDRGERVARRLDCGAVNINDALTNVFCPSLPMGGWKDSGIGYRAGGPSGLIKFCRQQAITAPRIPTQKSELVWYSSSRRQARMAIRAMRAFAGKGVRRFGVRPGK